MSRGPVAPHYRPDRRNGRRPRAVLVAPRGSDHERRGERDGHTQRIGSSHYNAPQTKADSAWHEGGVLMRSQLFACAVLTCLAITLPAQRAPRAPDSRKEERLKWFREAKYGLFIHWGLYAIPAGEWQGTRSPGLGEWIMNRSTIPVREYEKLASRFNPVKYNADDWVTLARDAGMKYIVITSKHHDGFAMFKSTASPYNIVDATPFKRDILKELADACRRQGVRLGFYYSQSQDWHEPNGAGNSWDFGPDEKKDYDQYLRGKAEPQVRELLTGYGPVALIWFDTPRMMTGDRAQRFADLVRSLQPGTLIDGRLGTEGDYRSTGDNVIPSDASGDAWETPATINDTWGYRTDDTNWKSPGQVTFKLVDIVSKGGNYLLNVGPRPDGTIPQASQDVLRTVGRWLTINGDAVHGAGPTPFGDELGERSARGAKDVRGNPLNYPQTEWRITAKPGKLYVTFFSEPRAPFALPAFKNPVRRIYQLWDGAPVTFTTANGRTVLDVKRPILDPMATVVVVEFDGDRIQR
jgi:alpha-L-fucosidase